MMSNHNYMCHGFFPKAQERQAANDSNRHLEKCSCCIENLGMSFVLQVKMTLNDSKPFIKTTEKTLKIHVRTENLH